MDEILNKFDKLRNFFENMKKNFQILLLGLFIFGTIGIILLLYLTSIIIIPTNIVDIGLWVGFWIFWIALVNEGLHWIKNGKRSDWADIVAILFLFITVFLITRDVLLSFVGAFSIYLLFGIDELKEYEILNKIVLISVITYNVIFIAGILDEIFQKEGFWQNIAFSFSFWLILILGFAFFGRKYLVVFRFMSVQYLTLLLYVVAWLVIVMINGMFSINFNQYIYEALILTNLIIYAFSGPLINILMGYKKENDPQLNQMVKEVAEKIGLNPKKIQVRFGKYPILNAMAYGAFWNTNMAIIAPDKESIPLNELKGIIAHELGHLKQKHTLLLTLVSTVEIFIFQLLKWPVTMYDYVFNKENQPFEMWVFLLINFGISIFLYIFVRYLEGHADNVAKTSGYASSISKGLYNLESFYATSHEIGLDATLLSDEKVSEKNQMLQYYSTAVYLNKMIIKPSRGILMSNFINSHPPSFHRIMILLDEKGFSPLQESFMPVLFLNQKKAREFCIKTNNARQKYMELVNQKIKEKFHFERITEFHETLQQKEFYSYKIGKTHAFLNMITGERWIGVIKAINYRENVTESLEYDVEIKKGENQTEIIKINPSICKEIPLFIGSNYKFRKEGILKLKNIELNVLYEGKNRQKKHLKDPYYKFINTGVAIFIDLNGKEIRKPIFKTKFPIAFKLIEEFNGKNIFLKKYGSYIALNVKELMFDAKGKFSVSSLKINNKSFSGDYQNSDSMNDHIYQFNSETHTIKYERLYFPIHNDDKTKAMETNFIKFLQKEQIRVIIVLKKAVNSEIDGRITNIEFDEKSHEFISKVQIISIFNEEINVNLKKIDGIFLNLPTLIVQDNVEISLFSKLINKIRQLNHPEKIFI
ncbi:M48 family metalloprotease [Candidatus Harpocratesius sp.]